MRKTQAIAISQKWLFKINSINSKISMFPITPVMLDICSIKLS